MTEAPHSYPESAEARRKERVAMAREICLHRGEDPNTIDRGGNEGWEKYEPLAGACIREAERLFARRTSAVAQAANVLSEEERRAVEHARYQVGQASMVQPDCCFDYDLVKDLLRAIDRAYPLPSTPRCTCAAIVNPNIPHARSCPLSRPECK